MSDYGSSPSSTWNTGYGFGNGRERGARRKKVFGYLKAANELRQSYAASWTAQRNASRDLGDEFMNTPGAFSDVEIARSGDEEMVIFPSYARRLDRNRITAQKMSRRESLGSIDEYRGYDGTRERDEEWETFDDEDAVVAVDVRGWVYAPYRGPMTRKQRLVVALARRLSGVAAPASSETGRDETSQEDDRIPRVTEKREEEIVDSEARFIIKTADKQIEKNLKAAAEELDEDPPGRFPQRTSTNASAQSSSTHLSKDELSIANGHLIERITPFLSNPMAGMAVTVFFFNDENSQSKNIMTNDSGHFSIRASLSFVPTHVRVLASEDLSAVKSIEIIEPTGVSMISDIDDTVKHSAIASGAKEMCRNIFARELSELTIEGVTDWYNAMVKAGVQIHYVSNSPWQLYPLLDRFFKMVGLPPGSFHLKQYSGIFQGIFEPTLERKKGNLERILQDFPDRKFILVGDSGESDLEVYTDLALTNPGRIIGIFIRDVTTPERTTFFEKSVTHLENTPSRANGTPELADQSDLAPNRPTLPPRPPRISDYVPWTSLGESEDLIDLSDASDKPVNIRTPPTIPSKPSALRSVTHTTELADKPPKEAIKRKPAPPLPRRSADKSDSLSRGETAFTRSSPGDKSNSSIDSRGRPPTNNRLAQLQDFGGDGAGISKPAPPPPPPRRSNTAASSASSSQVSMNNNCPVPERPPRFATSSTPPTRSSSPGRPYAYPGAPSMLRSPASNASLGRTSTSSSDTYTTSRPPSVNSTAPPRTPLPNKREELWRRRWERASNILADKGVVLGSWRVGKDVQDVCLWLVKEALQESSTSGEKETMKDREAESKWNS
ncbi:hypothetical protein BDW66DRAFT_7419 [Aspergillus desertorum]